MAARRLQTPSCKTKSEKAVFWIEPEKKRASEIALRGEAKTRTGKRTLKRKRVDIGTCAWIDLDRFASRAFSHQAVVDCCKVVCVPV